MKMNGFIAIWRALRILMLTRGAARDLAAANRLLARANRRRARAQELR
jgi:hypothetical protein